jgi:mannosyl-3-phosphoglycerate phosphatase
MTHLQGEQQVTGNAIIFTDLDGTLLNEVYSYDSALPALTLIEKYKIPLVICSSKTRSEIELYRAKLNNDHPFICENGGGVFITIGYFGPNVIIPAHHRALNNQYDVITLGANYSGLREALIKLRKEGFLIKGFGDMSAAEISQTMGLSIEEAEMAKQRDFDEPFLYEDKEQKIDDLLNSIKQKGLNATKGRIYHLLGQSDKGKAVSILIDLYKQKYGAVTTMGIGDSQNDLPMMEKVDIPIVVQKPDGTYDDSITIPNLIRAQGIGPSGWNDAVISFIPELLDSCPMK